jgi:hypothetical protein
MRSGWLAVLPAGHDPFVEQISVAIGCYVALPLAADDYRVVYPSPLPGLGREVPGRQGRV